MLKQTQQHALMRAVFQLFWAGVMTGLVAADMIGVRGVVAALWLSATVAVVDFLIWRRRKAAPSTPPTPVASEASTRTTRPNHA